MSTIRNRISRLWKRNESKSSNDEQMSRAQRSSVATTIVSLGSLTSSDTTQPPSLTGSNDDLSSGLLHHVASKTLQSLSETIRSRARDFYAAPLPQKIKTPDIEENGKSKSLSRRSAIWSSIKSSRSLGSPKSRMPNGSMIDQHDARQCSPNSISAISRAEELAPSIDINIPSSILLDSREIEHSTDIDTTYEIDQFTASKSSEAQQQWPSKALDAWQWQSSGDDDLSMHNSAPYHPNETEILHDSALFDCVPTIYPGYKGPQPHSTEVVKYDVDLNISSSAVFSPLELTSNSPTVPTKDETNSMGRLHHNSTMFSRGDQAYLRSPRSNGTSPSRMSYTQGDGDPKGLDQDRLKAKPSDDMTAQMSQPIPNQRPTFYRTTSLKNGLSDLAGCLSNVSNGAAESNEQRCTSSVYETDVESVPPNHNVPSMGSRCEWDQVRANREDRYSAIHTMDEETQSDENSDFGLELARASCRNVAHIAARDSSFVYDEKKSQAAIPFVDLDDPRVLDPRSVGANFCSAGIIVQKQCSTTDGGNKAVFSAYASETQGPSTDKDLSSLASLASIKVDNPSPMPSSILFQIEATERDFLNTEDNSDIEIVTTLASSETSNPIQTPLSLDRNDISKFSIADLTEIQENENTEISTNSESLAKEYSLEIFPTSHEDQSEDLITGEDLLKNAMETEKLHLYRNLSNDFDQTPSSSPRSISTTEGCAVKTHESSCHVPSPFPNLDLNFRGSKSTPSIVLNSADSLSFSSVHKDLDQDASKLVSSTTVDLAEHHRLAFRQEKNEHAVTDDIFNSYTQEPIQGSIMTSWDHEYVLPFPERENPESLLKTFSSEDDFIAARLPYFGKLRPRLTPLLEHIKYGYKHEVQSELENRILSSELGTNLKTSNGMIYDEEIKSQTTLDLKNSPKHEVPHAPGKKSVWWVKDVEYIGEVSCLSDGKEEGTFGVFDH